MSEDIDLSAPDHVNDELFNQILWSMLKGDQPHPPAVAKSPMQALQIDR
jgi:hypothetical protein